MMNILSCSNTEIQKLPETRIHFYSIFQLIEELFIKNSRLFQEETCLTINM